MVTRTPFSWLWWWLIARVRQHVDTHNASLILPPRTIDRLGPIREHIFWIDRSKRIRAHTDRHGPFRLLQRRTRKLRRGPRVLIDSTGATTTADGADAGREVRRAVTGVGGHRHSACLEFPRGPALAVAVAAVRRVVGETAEGGRRDDGEVGDCERHAVLDERGDDHGDAASADDVCCVHEGHDRRYDWFRKEFQLFVCAVRERSKDLLEVEKMKMRRQRRRLSLMPRIRRMGR